MLTRTVPVSDGAGGHLLRVRRYLAMERDGQPRPLTTGPNEQRPFDPVEGPRHGRGCQKSPKWLPSGWMEGSTWTT
jgi:hypothetical protein